MALQACLGLSILASERKVIFQYPILPRFVGEMQIKNLKVGTASVDLLLRRHDLDVGITVIRREGRSRSGFGEIVCRRMYPMGRISAYGHDRSQHVGVPSFRKSVGE